MAARLSFVLAAAAMTAAFASVPGARAQQAPAPVPTTAPDATAQIMALRAQLVAAQQEIVRLRGDVANQRDVQTALDQCRDKNGRLVSIANELIAAYEKRYRRGQFLPFDTGRRRFEAELQDIGDKVYDNRADAGPRRGPPQAPAAQPASSAQSGQDAR